MQANLLPRGAPAPKPRTTPHPSQAAMPVEFRSPPHYTAPVFTGQDHEPPKRTSSENPMSSLGSRNSSSGYQLANTGRSQSSTDFYQAPHQNQPHSFPQDNPRRETSKPYSSLEGALRENRPGNGQTHSHMYHPPTSGSSSAQAYPGQPTPHHTGQPYPPHQLSTSSQRPAPFPDHLQPSGQRLATVGAQGRAHSDTALRVSQPHPHPQPQPNSSHPHSNVKYNSQASFSGGMSPLGASRYAPRTSEASVRLMHSAPSSNTSRYANAIPHFVGKATCSQATLENARYALDRAPLADHENEDRHFALEGPNYKVFAVFDGHEGPRAAGFASNYMMQLFDTPSWNSIVKQANPSIIVEALGEFFKATENDYFRSVQRLIDEKEAIQRRIPPGLSSYAAFQQYPREVARLQEIEPKLAGGCTAVLALIVNDRLYVANAGDSRAVLARVEPSGTLSVEQLSIDHSVENEDELKRLEALGLDPKQLIRAGRLGMHENTRSIGDYAIKQGYKDVDTLRSAKSAPGIVTPYIMPSKTIDSTYQYLLLMTDGVYKSLESTFDQKYAIDPNKVIVGTLERAITTSGGKFDNVADSVLARVAQIHKDCYEKNARQDSRSALAVSCRKRDDMTLLVYRFPHAKSLN